MFFLGGMTMGYLEPPAKPSAKKEERVAHLPTEGDRRKIESTQRHPHDNVMHRSLIWAWHTVC